MRDRFGPFLEKVKVLTGKVNKKVWTLLIALLGVILAVVAAVLIFRGTRPYTVLFTGLAQDDMSSVLSFLESNGIRSYRVEGNDTILVPEGQEAALKAQIMASDYPSSGYGYRTYLDNDGIFIPDSAREQLVLYELQDRLGAVIKNMDGVKDAVVNLTPGENGRYILNQENVVQASANVTVTMMTGHQLSDSMASGIRSLLATSMKGLEIDQVVILDSEGNIHGGGASGMADSTELKMTLEARVNATVQTKVLQVLTPYFGQDNVRVSVYSSVDVGRVWTEAVDYIPDENTNWDSLGGHGLIGEYVWNNDILRNGETGAGGVVGTTTNADLNEYVTQGGAIQGNEQQIGTSGTVIHQNDVTTTQKENVGGVITDVQVAVSINSRTAGDINPANYIGHIARAAGIDEKVQNQKISVLALPFYQEPGLPGLPGGDGEGGSSNWMLYALIAGVALFLVILLAFLLLRSRSKKKAEQLRMEQSLAANRAAEAALLEATGPRTGGAQIMDLKSERSMELRQSVRLFAEENPEIAAQMIRSWLKGSDDNG